MLTSANEDSFSILIEREKLVQMTTIEAPLPLARACEKSSTSSTRPASSSHRSKRNGFIIGLQPLLGLGGKSSKAWRRSRLRRDCFRYSCSRFSFIVPLASNRVGGRKSRIPFARTHHRTSLFPASSNISRRPFQIPNQRLGTFSRRLINSPL